MLVNTKKSKMQNKKFLLIVAVSLMLCIPFNTKAQEAITASGGSFTEDAGSFSFSIGQVVYTTVTGINGIVPLGVQQPYKFRMEPGIEIDKLPTLNCLVYPNPTNNFLTLKIENMIDFSLSALSFQLFDIEGSLIEKKKITSNETKIPMMNLVPSVYQLVVIYNNEVKTFQIIKN
jgi:hypothetical protein